MKNWRTIRGGWQAAILSFALLSVPVFAQVLQKVGVSQHLNQQLPLDATFIDESGKPVKLGDYFGKHPAILALVYYTCPMLCSEEMDGLTSSLEMVKLNPGKDFDVVIISIDPSDTPEQAAKSKA